MSLDTYLRACSDRCSGCGYHLETQGCTCAGEAAKSRGMSVALAAHPDDRAKVEAAVRQLAATGRPFSANDARAVHGVTGGVVGAVFSSLASAGVIRSIGYEKSTKASTHAHPVATWVGVA